MKKLALLSIATMLASCAAAPNRIAPAQVSAAPYQSWSCGQLVDESIRLDASYQVIAKAQLETRHRDKVGVFWLGLPLSSMHGSNHAKEVAEIKGEQVAVQHTIETRGCDVSSATALNTAGMKPLNEWQSKPQ